jgi:hypothetical protein
MFCSVLSLFGDGGVKVNIRVTSCGQHALTIEPELR